MTTKIHVMYIRLAYRIHLQILESTEYVNRKCVHFKSRMFVFI